MFDLEQTYGILEQHFHKRVRRNEPLSAHCALGVGGSADFWVTLETQSELEAIIRFATVQQCPLLLVGAGRNTIFADAGVRGIVARLDTQHYVIENEGDGQATLVAEAGVRWQSLVPHLVSAGWTGLEFGIGIPGTLGAGLVSNAGAHDQALGQALEWIEVLDARSCNEGSHEVFVPLVRRRYTVDELDLGYRHSRFRVNSATHFDAQSTLVFAEHHLIEPSEMVMTLGLRLHHQDPEQLKQRVASYQEERQAQEPALPRTGLVFKDPLPQTARELIAQTGLAGRVFGKAQINQQNANYISNLGGATAEEVLALMKEAHRRVLAQFGLSLVPNVELRGEWKGTDVVSC